MQALALMPQSAHVALLACSGAVAVHRLHTAGAVTADMVAGDSAEAALQATTQLQRGSQAGQHLLPLGTCQKALAEAVQSWR